MVDQRGQWRILGPGHARRQTRTGSERDDRPAPGRCAHLHGPFSRSRPVPGTPSRPGGRTRELLAAGTVRVTSSVTQSPPRRGPRYRSLMTSRTSPVRLVAVDRDGEEHPADVRSGGGVKDFRQFVVEFDLPPEQIKEFRLQTRPYEGSRSPVSLSNANDPRKRRITSANRIKNRTKIKSRNSLVPTPHRPQYDEFMPEPTGIW